MGLAMSQLCFISTKKTKERKNGHNDESQPQDVSRLPQLGGGKTSNRLKASEGNILPL